jgi:hypothetical protein
MKVLLFVLVLATGSMGFAQSAADTQAPRGELTTAVLKCTTSIPDGELLVEMLFDYDIDSRTYTLTSVGAAGRGVTRDSPNYFWTVKSDIDLSRLAADVVLSQDDGSHIEFTMLARMGGIVMRRADDGFLPDQNLGFSGLIGGKNVSSTLKCSDIEKPEVKFDSARVGAS